MTHPVRCAWCGRWRSPEDQRRAEVLHEQVSHTICEECMKKFDLTLNPPLSREIEPTMAKPIISLADEASAIQKQIGYAERRLGRLGRDYGHRDLLKASKVLNALNHVLDFGAQYGPQLTGAVEDLLKEYGS